MGHDIATLDRRFEVRMSILQICEWIPMLSWFQWLEHSWLGTAVNNSPWAFAAIEAGLCWR
jgi:hypothetical protein